MEQAKLRCTIIGAGVSGLLMAYKLRKHLPNHVEFRIFEKNPELGGTWFENRYPGCACDVPSHCYQFTFAPNPSWTKFYASSQEIQEYLKNVAHHFELEQFIHYNRKVIEARWSEDTGIWSIQVENGPAVESELLINAGGILNNLQVPKIEGVSTFSGLFLHTAAWDSAASLKNKRVAVIGSGASAIQLIPKVRPLVEKLQVYIRTPSWICAPPAMPVADTTNYAYTATEKVGFRDDPDAYLDTRKNFESQFNGMFRSYLKGSPEQAELRSRFEARMKELILDEELQKHLIPDFETGCKRINPGEEYLSALQTPNVEPIFDPIDRITPSGVVAGGVEYPADILIAATGFDTTFKPRFPIYGINGVNLQDLWKDSPTSYMSVAASGFPNYLIFLGPNSPVPNGSVMGSVEGTADYFVRIIRKMLRERIKSFDVREEAQVDFDLHTQTCMQDLVWTGTCRSWFKNEKTGKVTGAWPGSSLHYLQVLAENRWEDFKWTYKGERYAYWGHGISWVENPDLDPIGVEEYQSSLSTSTLPKAGADLGYYLWKSPPLPNVSISDKDQQNSAMIGIVAET